MTGVLFLQLSGIFLKKIDLDLKKNSLDKFSGIFGGEFTKKCLRALRTSGGLLFVFSCLAEGNLGRWL